MNYDLGKKGEQISAEYLEKKGYEILEKNYRIDHLEADIIARKNNTIVFVEVKTRSKSIDYDLLISAKKQDNLLELADRYIREKNLNADIRFDVIIIVMQKNKYSLKHIKSAFRPEF